jgi:iron complex outermembrane receptor protein
MTTSGHDGWCASRVRSSLLFATCLLPIGVVHADHDPPSGEVRLPATVVRAAPLSPWQAQPEWAPLAETNTALMLDRIPGANVNFNGALAGIPQYRGLFGDRVNVLVDGVQIPGACTNAMDHALHYMPRGRLGLLEVLRGVAPVSSGLETLGGTVLAESQNGTFGTGDEVEVSGQFNVGGQSVDRGYSTSGFASFANERHRLQVGGVREQGDDRRFGGGGFIRPTRYERDAFDIGYGLHLGAHEFGFDFRRNDTRDAGTPALPMDDIRTEANLFRLRYGGRWQGLDLEARLFHTAVEHLMSNFDLRPVPVGRARRFALADADSGGYRLSVGSDLAGGRLLAGADGLFARHSSELLDPDNPAFFLDSFRDVRRDLYGFFAEWERPLATAWDLHLGLRHTVVAMDAPTVDASMARAMPGSGIARLRNRFNAADRSQVDHNTDAVLRLVHSPIEGLSLEWALARKMRSPNYQERFLWAPLEATAGLADGNLYTGDINLRPEKALQAEFGVDWRGDRIWLAPRAFYHHIDDYIQGVPHTDPTVIAIATAGGDPTPLRFANVGARLYGLDTTFGARLDEHWRLDGVLSWVRGERTDIEDDLFRIAPLNLVMDLTWHVERWSLTASTQWNARQDAVSVTNGEPESPGFGLLNLYGQYHLPRQGLTLSAGLENVLDQHFRPHLNGFNRALGSDVPLMARLPGDGINAFLQAAWRF